MFGMDTLHSIKLSKKKFFIITIYLNKRLVSI
jgi:hypothetical protein